MRSANDSSLGDPVCGHCRYPLKGLTDSARCPECGRPIVETLVRTGFTGFRGVRYQSRRRLAGLPLFALASGPTAEERVGHARGIVAVGDIATGIIAVGAIARGGIAIGSVSIGLFSLGALALGLAAVGGVAAGFFACGGVSAGVYAVGGAAFFFERGFGGLRMRLPRFW